MSTCQPVNLVTNYDPPNRIWCFSRDVTGYFEFHYSQVTPKFKNLLETIIVIEMYIMSVMSCIQMLLLLLLIRK